MTDDVLDLNLITRLERRLDAYVRLQPHAGRPGDWLLSLQLFYDGRPAGRTSFNLSGYNAAEAEYVARNIRSHPYLMREIDEYLWGESD